MADPPWLKPHAKKGQLGSRQWWSYRIDKYIYYIHVYIYIT
jgi:hypothetical protein